MTPSAEDALRVLVVEDDPVTADAHALYVSRVPGFAVAGIAHTALEAFHAVERHRVDLLLLDLYLPEGRGTASEDGGDGGDGGDGATPTGLALLRRLRSAGRTTDVFAVTSARDLTVIREGVSLGVVQHVLKPFTFRTLRERLLQYERYKATEAAAGSEVRSQAEVDSAMAVLRTPKRAMPPKGMSAATLDRVVSELREADDGLTAASAAERIGVNRITARRYLEHLVEAGRARRAPLYGQVGRPEYCYTWRD